MLLDGFGFGLGLPVLPPLISHFVGGDAVATAQALAGLFSLFSAIQFLAMPVLGGLSDRFGRRPIFLWSLTGAMGDYLVSAVAPHLWWLFAARIWTGVTAANVVVANAQVADFTPPERRAHLFGLVAGLFGLGLIVGAIVGGALFPLGLRAGFIAATAVAAVNVGLAAFLLPESLAPNLRRSPEKAEMIPLLAIRVLRRRPAGFGLAVSLVLGWLAAASIQAIWLVYTADRYGWTPLQNGFGLAVYGIAMAVSQGVLVGYGVKRFGGGAVILGGVAISAAGCVIAGLASAGWGAYVALAILALGEMAVPATRGRLSGLFPPEEQGRLQGVLSSLNSLASVAAPLVAAGLFSRFAAMGGIGAGAPLFGAALLCALGGLVAWKSLAVRES